MAAVTFKTGIIITADASGALKAMGLTESQLKRLNMSMGRNTGLAAKQGAAIGKLRGQVVNLARSFGLLAGGTVIGSAFVTLGRTVARYGDTLKQVQAITSRGTRGTNDQIALFKRLEEETKRLGATTRFSASQAAEGAKFLARAGFTTGEVIQSLDSTLRLAQAGALGLGRAADIASNVMKGFQLEASEMTRIVDVLAVATASTNTSVEQLGVAMSFVAPASASLGIRLEETTAAIGALSDAGIQGERAGTGLRQILIKLGQTGENITGGFQDGLLPVLLQLRDRQIDLQDATALVGVRQASALLVLVEATQKIGDLTKAYDDATGKARTMAEIMDESLLGALYRVRSAWEAMQLAFAAQGAESVAIQGLNAIADSMRYIARNVEILQGALVGLAVFIGTKFFRIVGLGLLAQFGTDAEKAGNLWQKVLRRIWAGKTLLLGAAAGWYAYNQAVRDGTDSLAAAITPIEELRVTWGKLDKASRDAALDARVQVNQDRIHQIEQLQKELTEAKADVKRLEDGTHITYSGGGYKLGGRDVKRNITGLTEEYKEQVKVAGDLRRQIAQLQEDYQLTAEEAASLAAAIKLGRDQLTEDLKDWSPAQKDIIAGIQEWGAETKTAQEIFNQAMADLELSSERAGLAVKDAFKGNPELLEKWIKHLRDTLRSNDSAWVEFNKQLEDAKGKLNKLRTGQEIYNDTIAQLKVLLAGKGEGKNWVGLSQEQFDKLAAAAEKARKESTDAWKQFNEDVQDARSNLERLKPAHEAINEQLEKWRALVGVEGGITELEFYTLSADAAERLKEANIKAAEESENVWVQFGLELSDTFRDSFIKAEGHLDSFIDRVKDTLKEQFLRSIFDATIGNFFQNLSVGINQASGGSNYGGLLGGITSVLRGTGLGTTGQGAAPGGAGYNPYADPGNYPGVSGGAGGSDLLGSASNAATLARLYSGGVFAGIGGAVSTGASWLGSVSGIFGNATSEIVNQGIASIYNGTAQTGVNLGFTGDAALGAGTVVNIGAGIAGSYAGNVLGEALFGGEAESSWGATAGGIIGGILTSWSGGWGIAIGSAIGAALDVALGGDGRTRSNTGFLVGDRVGSSAQDAYFTETAASGLRIQAFERRGDYNVAIAMQEAALEIDQILTDASRAFGLVVDFSDTTLRGVHGDAGHALAPGQVGGFFGAVGFNGEGTVEGALDLFTREWIAELEDQIPALVRPLIRGLEGTAEELANGFGAALSIAYFLDLDVVNRTEEALKELGEQQLSLIETYDKMVDSVHEAIQGLDGSAASIQTLNEALREQKIATAQLVLAYREVGINVDSVLGGTIERIRESTLDTEQLYGLRRDQISDLFQELQVATSPEEIADLVASIDALSNEAFNLLDDSQQATLADEFIGFLTNAADTASNIISDQIAALGETEQSIERDFTVKVSSDEFEAVVERFGEYVDAMPAAGFPGPGGGTPPEVYGATSPNHPRYRAEVNV